MNALALYEYVCGAVYYVSEGGCRCLCGCLRSIMCNTVCVCPYKSGGSRADLVQGDFITGKHREMDELTACSVSTCHSEKTTEKRQEENRGE